MKHRIRHRIMLVAAVTALAVLAAACGGGSDSSGSGSPEPRPATIDWSARTVDIDTPDGWSIAFCDGDGPFLCIERDGTQVGGVELLDFHVASLAEFDGDLDAWARDLYATIIDDRRVGCGEDYRIEADAPVRATVSGNSGIRYSFTGSMADGTPAERAVGYAVTRGDTLFLLGANAYEPDGCVGTEGGEFTVANVQAFEPIFADIAAGSVLPDLAGDGAGTGYLREVDSSGRALLDAAEILSGEEAVQAAIEAGVIEPGETLETDFFVRDSDDATVELQITDRTHIELFDCTAGCELRELSAADFLTGAVEPYGGDGAIYAVALVDGTVTSLVEQYLP